MTRYVAFRNSANTSPVLLHEACRGFTSCARRLILPRLSGHKRQRLAPALIQHSDRGIQYAADEYRQALAAAKITPSMSRKGNCLDNAPMESFSHTLKAERVHHRVYATRDEAWRALFAYIKGF